MDVFLGSSNALVDQRLAFCSLVEQLAGPVYDLMGVELDARVWETESYAMERDRSKQAAYDQVIRGCELTFFLVDSYLGSYTLHEFLVATEQLELCGAPKVTAWVRPESADCQFDDNTRELLRRLNDDRARGVRGLDLRSLGSDEELLLDMASILSHEVGGLPLAVRDGGLWAGHERLIRIPQQLRGKAQELFPDAR